MAYSVDLRKKVVSYIKAGNKRKEAAEIFGVSLRAIVRWIGMDRDGSLYDAIPNRP